VHRPHVESERVQRKGNELVRILNGDRQQIATSSRLLTKEHCKLVTTLAVIGEALLGDQSTISVYNSDVE
jgi:hypothetical protein